MSRRTSRSTCEASVQALLGVVGRKTGIAPKANVLKDADDMDNVDDWFASSDEEMADEQMEEEEVVEEVEEEVEEEGEMEEEVHQEQEPSFIQAALSPPPRRSLAVLDQSLMNVTPIRPSNRSVFNEQDSLPWVSPELSPSPPPRAAPTKPAASKADKTERVPARVPPPVLRASPPASPPPAVEAEPSFDDGNVSGFGDTSGYSSPQPSVTYGAPSMHTTGVSSVDSVRTPPPPKVLLKDSTVHESSRRGKRSQREESSMDLSPEDDDEDAASTRETDRRKQQPVAKASGKRRKEYSDDDDRKVEEDKAAKRRRPQVRDKDASDVEEESSEGRETTVRNRHGARSTKDVKSPGTKGRMERSEKNTREDKGTKETGHIGRGKKRKPVSDESDNEEEEEEEDEEEEEEELRRNKRGKTAKHSPPTANGERKRTKGREDVPPAEEPKRDKGKGKSKAPATPSPPSSPGYAEASVLGLSGPTDVTIAGEVSMDTGHSPDTDRYITVPLKDHSSHSPAVHTRSQDESALDLTNYEEMPTFVDPNDETWAANESLEAEVANLPPARRSSRKKIKPLAYWKNERVVYGYNEGEDMRSVKDVVQVKTPQPTKKKKATKVPTKGKKKGRL